MTRYDPFDPPQLATPLRRLVGFVIDLALLTLLALASLPVLASLAGSDVTVDATTAVTIVNVVLIGLYQVGFVVATGQTPGKMLVRTRVLDASARALPTFTSALARYALPMAVSFVPIIGLALFMIVYAWLTWDEQRQGLHDKLASTIVVDAAWRPAGDDAP